MPILEPAFSKNPLAATVVGLRPRGLDMPFPLDMNYHCPKCPYITPDTRLQWSEYETFIWCSGCNRDYPLVLCIVDEVEATEAYLKIVQYLQSKRKVVGPALADVKGVPYQVNQLLISDSWDQELKDNNGHDILIERRRQADDGSLKWIILMGNDVLTKTGQWVRDPSPSWRTEAHMQATRYNNLEEALAQALQAKVAVEAIRAKRKADFLAEKESKP